MSVFWKVSQHSYMVWQISVKIHTENKDSRLCNVAAKSFDFWHTGFTWQQLIYDCQTYLAMISAKE